MLICGQEKGDSKFFAIFRDHFGIMLLNKGVIGLAVVQKRGFATRRPGTQ